MAPTSARVERAVRALSDQLGRHSGWGSLIRREQSELSALPPSLSSVPDVAAWYKMGSPEAVHIPWMVERLRLYSPSEVTQRQTGYRQPAGNTAGSATPWNPKWWVVGDAGGDPLIVSCPEGTVLMAVHGLGFWNPVEVARDVADLLAAVVAWVRIWDRHQGRIRDEDGELGEGVRVEFRTELQTFMDEQHCESLMQFVG